MNRTEKDSLGTLEIPSGALYGIHSLRASHNFPDKNQCPVEWYMAMGKVKVSVFRTYRKFRNASAEKYGEGKAGKAIPDEILNALTAAAGMVAGGKHYEHFKIGRAHV